MEGKMKLPTKEKILKGIKRAGFLFFLACTLFLIGCAGLQRKLIFHPCNEGHVVQEFTSWTSTGKALGYAREVENPESIWLMLHGNAGEASHRAYALPSFPENASVYVLEYPGYGPRKGNPSRKNFNAAAREGFSDLKARYPELPICVAGESIGTGPASYLGSLENPPDKIVLVVPFDKFTDVAQHHMWFLPVRLFLMDRWDNSKALSGYKGHVDIFATPHDRVIPVEQAHLLAKKIPQAKLYLIDGGHNDWAKEGRVNFRYP